MTTTEDLRRATKSYMPCSEPDCATCEPARAVMSRLEAAALALWSVRVLDGWRTDNTRRQHVERSKDEAGSVCEIELYFERILSKEYHYGPTPDAARLAAARSVWSTLPEDVRRVIGEEPGV